MAAAIVAFMATGAVARNIPEGGLTVEEVQAWLQQGGFKAQIETGKSGERNIYSASNGTNFHIFFYDCKGPRCGSLQFSIGIDTKGKETAARMSDWNAKNRWARASVDRVNDPWLEYDVDLTPGGTYELLDDEFGIWRDSLDHFTDAVHQH